MSRVWLANEGSLETTQTGGLSLVLGDNKLNQYLSLIVMLGFNFIFGCLKKKIYQNQLSTERKQCSRRCPDAGDGWGFIWGKLEGRGPLRVSFMRYPGRESLAVAPYLMDPATVLLERFANRCTHGVLTPPGFGRYGLGLLDSLKSSQLN